jgi:Golgi nucleoside diphosphatase
LGVDLGAELRGPQNFCAPLVAEFPIRNATREISRFCGEKWTKTGVENIKNMLKKTISLSGFDQCFGSEFIIHADPDPAFMTNADLDLISNPNLGLKQANFSKVKYMSCFHKIKPHLNNLYKLHCLKYAFIY